MTQEAATKPRLPVHEWLAVVLMIVILAALVLVVQLQRMQQEPAALGSPFYTTEQEIEIKIDGAVLHPGSYRFKRGALLKEALAQAEPSGDADLRRVSPEKRLRDGQVIHIKTLPKKKNSTKKAKAQVFYP